MDWNDFIKNIDLQEYVVSVGYKYVKAKSCAKFKVYSNEQTGDLIYIFKHSKTGTLCYKGLRNEGSDQGNIVNFVMNRLNRFVMKNTNRGDYVRAAKILSDWLNLPEPTRNTYKEKVYNTGTIVAKEKNDKFDFYLLNSIKITSEPSVDYLVGRGISKDIYTNPIFVNRVVLSKPVWFRENGEAIHENEYRVGFPLIYDNDVVGMELRYPDKKLFAQHSNREQGMWFSELNKSSSQLYIAESPIDCMSHFALSNPAERKKFCYVATMGTPSSKHYDLVIDYINQFGFKKVILINDNDTAGQYFNLRFISNVLKDKLHLSISSINSNKFVFELTLSDYTQGKIRNFFASIREYNSAEEKAFVDGFGGEESQFKQLLEDSQIKSYFDKVQSKVKIVFPSYPRAICLLNEFLTTLKLTDFKLGYELSEHKDWNDDLKQKQQQVVFAKEHSVTEKMPNGGKLCL